MFIAIMVIGTIVAFLYRIFSNPEGLFSGEDAASPVEWLLLILAIIAVCIFFYHMPS